MNTDEKISMEKALIIIKRVLSYIVILAYILDVFLIVILSKLPAWWEANHNKPGLADKMDIRTIYADLYLVIAIFVVFTIYFIIKFIKFIKKTNDYK